MTYSIEHRMQQAPSAKDRGVLSSAAAKGIANADTTLEPALTRRERKVKDILLKELAKLNINEYGAAGLSYAEKQHLEKGLSTAYIDKQLAAIGKQQRNAQLVMKIGGAFFAIVLVFMLGYTGVTGAWDWNNLVTLLALAAPVVAMVQQLRSLQRKRFIYEALRELSGANEADVVLNQAALDADALIRGIVDRELEAEKAYPMHRLRN